MNCDRCEQWLQEVLDGEEPSGVLVEHLGGCPGCRELYESALTLRHVLRRAPRPEPTDGLTDRVVSAVLSDRRARQRRRGLVARVAALAATALLAFAISGRSPAPSATPAPIARSTPEPTPSLREAVRNAGTAVVDSARRQAGEAMDAARLLFPVVEGPVLPPMDAGIDWPQPAAGPLLAAGLEPVAGSARRALALFVRDLTPGTLMGKPGS